MFLSVLLFLKTSYTDPGFLRYHSYIAELYSYYSSSSNSGSPELSPSKDSPSKKENTEDRGENEADQDGPIQLEEIVQNPVEEESIEDFKKICFKCSIEKMMRSKHCKECNTCVALYDHHCYWMGNCIGQANRRYLWIYLVFQSSLIAFTLYLLVSSLNSTVEGINYIRQNGLILICIAIVGMSSLGVFAMLLFQTFLALTNQTTREIFDRDRLKYLAEWPTRLYGPFSRGIIKNLAYFFYYANKGSYTEWKTK